MVPATAIRAKEDRAQGRPTVPQAGRVVSANPTATIVQRPPPTEPRENVRAVRHAKDPTGLSLPGATTDRNAAVTAITDEARKCQRENALSTTGKANLLPGTTIPAVTIPEVATPKIAIPEVATLGTATPDLTISGMVTPGVATPGVATLKAAHPRKEISGTTIPETSIPGVATPGVATREAVIPEAVRRADTPRAETTPGAATPGMVIPEVATRGVATRGMTTLRGILPAAIPVATTNPAPRVTRKIAPDGPTIDPDRTGPTAAVRRSAG